MSKYKWYKHKRHKLHSKWNNYETNYYFNKDRKISEISDYVRRALTSFIGEVSSPETERQMNRVLNGDGPQNHRVFINGNTINVETRIQPETSAEFIHYRVGINGRH